MRNPLRFFAIALATLMTLGTANASELIALNASNETVLRIQQRLVELQYFSFKCTGTFGGMTRESIIQFQSLNGIMADGTVGEETLALLFSADANPEKQPVRNPIPANVKIPIGSSAAGGNVPPQLGEAEKWSTISAIMKEGETYSLTDLTDQKTFTIVRTGGVNHARVETASAQDTQTFLSVFGGEVNWSKRPVIVTIGTVRYAASLQGMPSGTDTVAGNNMDGSCALYFMGSTSDVHNLPDFEHRTAVNKASNPSSWQ